MTSKWGLVSSSGQFDNLNLSGSRLLSHGSLMAVRNMAILYTCVHQQCQYEEFKCLNFAVDFCHAHKSGGVCAVIPRAQAERLIFKIHLIICGQLKF